MASVCCALVSTLIVLVIQYTIIMQLWIYNKPHDDGRSALMNKIRALPRADTAIRR